MDMSTDTSTEMVSDVNVVDEGFADDSIMKELNTAILEPDSYLEMVSDYVNAEAISAAISELFEAGPAAAYEAYSDKVQESYDERQLAKQAEDWEEEPAFTKSEVSTLIEDAETEIGEAKTETEELREELEETQAELKETQAELEATQTDLEATKQEAEEAKTEATETQAELEKTQAELEATKAEVESAKDAKDTDVHHVQPGDSLSKIAEQEYGDANKWPAIYEANKEVIGDDPSRIEVGQELVIPPESEAGAVAAPVIAPTPPPDTPPPPQGDPGEGELSTEELERAEELENKIETLTDDPHGITERNTTSDQPLDARRAALKEDLEDLERDYLKEGGVSPENYEEFNERYEALREEYNEVSADLYENHVKDIPLQYVSDKAVLDRLIDNTNVINDASPEEKDGALDKAWRDYDRAKSGEGTVHGMAGGYIPNPEEGRAIDKALDDADV